MSDETHESRGRDRRSFLRTTGGYATGIAVGASLGTATAGAASGEAIDTPTTPYPEEPVMAYVHDAKRGEVTIMHGTREVTYRDRALAKRLLKAADDHLR